MALLSPSPPDAPPVVSWEEWRRERLATIRQGTHLLFVGPTQSGKTLLCREMARQRDYVVVGGTKPVDPQLDAYLDEGYVRIDHWPPTASDYRAGRRVWDDEHMARFILWPKITRRDQLRSYAPVFARLCDEVFIDGRWTVVIDEGLWWSSPTGLNLGPQLGDLAYGTASNGVSLYVCVQRPANIPPVVWTSVSEAEIFHMGRVDDVREIASLGTYDPQAAAQAVRRLRGHQFLSLPCRGQSEWAVSEVVVD